MTDITLIAYDPAARSVTFSAYGKEKTITGLGDFESKETFIQYLQSVAETDLKEEAQELSPLPDMGSLIGKKLPTVE